MLILEIILSLYSTEIQEIKMSINVTVCYERLTLWTPINFFPISARQMTTLYPIPTLNPYLYYS